MSFFKISITLTFTLLSALCFGQDLDGCRDHPLFPDRVPHYYITECLMDCDSSLFHFMPEKSGLIPSGKKTYLRYDFNFESMEMKPECAHILQSYETLAMKIGTLTIFEQADVNVRIFNVRMPNEDALWVKVECGGDEHNDYYILTVVEFPGTKKE